MGFPVHIYSIVKERGGMGVTIGYNMYVLYRYGHQFTVDLQRLCAAVVMFRMTCLLLCVAVIHFPFFIRRFRLTLHNHGFSLSIISTRWRLNLALMNAVVSCS